MKKIIKLTKNRGYTHNPQQGVDNLLKNVDRYVNNY